MNKEKDISLTPTIEEQPAPTAALTPSRALAIRWVFLLELKLDSTQLHPTAYEALLNLLSKECKNPMDWTDHKCEFFLVSIIEARPTPKQLWGPVMAEYHVDILFDMLSPEAVERLYYHYFKSSLNTEK